LFSQGIFYLTQAGLGSKRGIENGSKKGIEEELPLVAVIKRIATKYMAEREGLEPALCAHKGKTPCVPLCK
jgi:hypothetical protein